MNDSRGSSLFSTFINWWDEFKQGIEQRRRDRAWAKKQLARLDRRIQRKAAKALNCIGKSQNGRARRHMGRMKALDRRKRNISERLGVRV